MRVRLATRTSPLARWQAEHVAELLRQSVPGTEVELVEVSTEGDRRPDVPIAALGGQGVFVKEVQQAIVDGRADAAVHSAKDLPASATAPGLVIAAVPERGDPRDALVGCRLDDLPPGARVATGSARRRVQLAHRRPDLTFAGLRGNLDRRLAAAADHSAVVVAAVAIARLGRTPEIVDLLSPTVMVPQVGQGALAVECRDDDRSLRDALAAVEHAPSRRAVDAERSYLATLGGGCDLPVGAYAVIGDGGTVTIRAVLGSPDGHVLLHTEVAGADPVAVGSEAAHRLLDGAGGRALLFAFPGHAGRPPELSR